MRSAIFPMVAAGHDGCSRLRAAAVVALAGAALVAGCATFLPQSRAPVMPAAFDLIGRVAASHDGNRFFSNVRWHHLSNGEEIWLLTPAGQTLARIVSDADGATLTGADRSEYRGSDVESLTRQVLGWELPLTYMGWWVRGEAAPDGTVQDVARDGQSRYVALSQGGWRVTMTWGDGGAGSGLPRRLEFASGSDQIRLVIDGWRPVGQQ